MESREIVTIADPDLKRYVLPYVAEAYQISGLSIPDKDTLTFTVEKFCFVLKTKFKSVSFDHVAKFLNAGSWGEYGEFKNISVKTMVHWMTSGLSKMNLKAGVPEDNSTMQKKFENIVYGLKKCDEENGTNLLEELKQHIDRSISRNNAALKQKSHR